uniref:Uncharacterized protein n=1 Tax=Anguilla anguilla TaxID=7936 RepID=A0A0E9VB46_ANGAN
MTGVLLEDAVLKGMTSLVRRWSPLAKD